MKIERLNADGTVEISDGSWRRVVIPMDDVSSYPEEIREQISSHWAEEVGGKTRAQIWAESNVDPDEREGVSLVDYAGQVRWQVENGGITLPGGVEVSTDSVSQSKIAAAKTAFDNGALSGSIKFKAKNGWFDANSETLTAVYTVIVTHVQSCYAKELEVIEAIQAGTITTHDEIDQAFSSL